MNRNKTWISSLVLVVGLMAAASGAHAALNTWSTAIQCDPANNCFCSGPNNLDETGWASLLVDNNCDGVPPMAVTSTYWYKTRVRVRCNGGSWVTGAWSTDGNCGSSCERSSVTCSGVNVTAREGMISAQ